MSRYLLSFVIGAAFGVLLMRSISEPRQVADQKTTITQPATAVADKSSVPLVETPVANELTPTLAVISSTPTVASNVDTSPTIPARYRRNIGPAVKRISFGEKYEVFETEPIDAPWAHAMETGMSNYLAQLGPESGSVFEFIQCRTSACVLAGYSLPGYEVQSASILSELRKESWWQGGGSSYSSGGGDDDQNTFVIMLDRD